MSIENRDIPRDADVYTADDEQVGQVREGHANYLHVHRSRLFGRDEYYFPTWAVGRVTADRVYLTLTRDEINGQDWSSHPSPGETREQRFGVAVGGQHRATDTAAATATTRGAGRRLETSGAMETLDQPEIVVPVVEERLEITKRPVELGEVIINREIFQEERTVPVEVAHEEVRVERRTANREATPDDLRLAGGEGLAMLSRGESVVIPLIEEVVEVRKRMMVREELLITKQRVTERHEVTETVRRVEPRVDSSGSLERDVEGTATRTGTTGRVATTGAATTGRVADTTAGGRAAGSDDRNILEKATDAAGDAIDRARQNR